MRRIAIMLLALLAAVLVLAACGRGSQAPAAEDSVAESIGAAPAAESVEEAATEEATEETASEEAPAQEAQADEVTPAESTMGEVAMDGSMLVLPEVDPLTVEGDVVTAGSSTVFPLAEAVGERFYDEGYGGTVTIDSIGSGAGFSRFCEAGETDIANASRPIRDSEVDSCATIGRTPIEFRVGTDALAVVINPENDWATDVTLEELAAIFTAEKWSDVNPEWPDETILRYIPGTDSGTFDYFVEAVFEEDPEPVLTAANTQFSEDDNVLVIGVEGSPYATGFFGYAYYSENADALGIMDIEGVEPSFESVEGGDYALARPLFIYSDATIMTEKPQVAAYVNYFLSSVNEVIEEVGYFPASETALNEAKAAAAGAMGLAVPSMDSGEAAEPTEEASEEAAATAVMLPEVDPLTVEGDVVTAGSSTVFPLAEAVGERFYDEGYGGTVTIDSIGSGAGFSRFCEAGETDIANASRPIRDSEVDSCATIGRTPIEFRVGTDALAVVINPENDWATDVTLEELAAIFTAEKWSDVNPEWPDETILRYIPGTDSGTFDYFVEAVFEEDPEPVLTAANTQFSEDDNVLVIGVEGSPYATGFFGYAYYSENADALGIMNIEGVEPSFESVEGGDYALARPLFIYSDATIMTEKPQVAAYVNYFLSSVNEVIEEVGYFPASETALNEAKDKWSAAVGQ